MGTHPFSAGKGCVPFFLKHVASVLGGAVMLGVGAAAVGASAQAAEVHVLISGGLSAALAELAPEFERATGHKVVTSRGGSLGRAPNSIAGRLDAGQRADVLIMVADGLEVLDKEGWVAPNSRVDIARSQLGMAVKAGARVPDIGTLEAFKRAMLEAKSVAISTSASGVYFTQTLFPRLGIAEQMNPKTRSAGGPSGEAVARGEFEVALQQISELLPVAGTTFVGPLPREAQLVTLFSAAVAAKAVEPEAARSLIRFLASPAAATAITKSGMEPIAR